MKIKPVKQRDASACAPTCIEMTLKYFDVPHTLKEIAVQTDYKKDGVSNDGLVAVLKQFELSTKTYKNTTWKALQEMNIKEHVIIVSWMLDGYIGHVSVVEDVTDTHIVLAEPTTGKYLKIEKIKFLRLWWDFEARGRDIWYPETKADVQLRWMVIVRK